MEVLKKIIIKIINFFKLLILTILSIIKQLFFPEKKNIKKNIDEVKTSSSNKTTQKPIKETDIASPPDEDNIKTNPHNTTDTQSSDTNQSNEIVLKIPKEKLYKVYNKDNELKYLTLSALLDLIVKEELESIYKEEKFKVKDATNEQLKRISEIKERILPEIITQVENETLRDSEKIRKEVRIKLEYDLITHPLLPKKEITIEKVIHVQEPEKTKDDNIYSLAINKKKDLNIKEEQKTPIPTPEPIISLPTNQELKSKLDNTNVSMVPTVDEIPDQDIKDTIKNGTIISAAVTASIIKEVLTSPEKEKTSSHQAQASSPSSNESKEELENIKETHTPIEAEPPQEQEELTAITEIQEEIKKNDTTTKEELEELKQKIDEKINTLEEEQQEKVKQKVEPELIKDSTIVAVSETTDSLIYESKQELQKEEFEDKDYERIERQIDKMLEDISNTFLRYEDKMSPKQKKKLQAEEEKLRETKEMISSQKSKDISIEIGKLTEPIRESERNGLEQELRSIQTENEQEVSNNLLERMDRLEGMTKEQVANVDKRIMLKRFNKINLLLEMTSLLALPFVRNKYFFYFTVGLIIDNHFNFINAFFNRKMNKYEPADLSQIRQGQDALNGALDITFKNLVELDYLEQQALSRYPELANDPHFVHQVTKIRTQLNQKYNKLMKKNKTMEKYYTKTKNHIKILKPEQQKNAN